MKNFHVTKLLYDNLLSYKPVEDMNSYRFLIRYFENNNKEG